MILYLKNGSGIHIKKKNRGKFTSYCGGNVTSACIAKAKRSGNPTLVKRATFAANARKWKHQQGGIIDKISDAYQKFSDNATASTIYDLVNAGLYVAAPFTGGSTLIPAMAMTGLQAGGATANAYKKGLNVQNGLDIASAIPGFGLTEKAVKASMKPVMKMVGKNTKKISRATKYVPIKDKILVTTPSGHTFNFGKYRPTYFQMAMWDKKYAPYAALVYGEDAANHLLNGYQVAKDVKQHKQGGSIIHKKLIKRNS